MHPRIAWLLGASALITLAAGCGEPQLAPAGEESSLAQGGPEPRAPSNLTATALSASQIRLAWQDNSPNETGFEVQRSPEHNGAYTLVTTTAANVRTYTDGDRPAVSTNCYMVRSLKQSGSKTSFSAYAGPVCATTLQPPAAAFDLRAVPQNSSTIAIRWGESSSDESGFRVQRGPGETGPWADVTTTGPNVTQAQNTVPTDVPFCYRVLAFNGNGDAEPSNVDCTAAPAAPANLRAEAADEHTVDLTWDAHPPDPAPVNDGYQVLRWDPGVWEWSEIAVLSASATGYRDTGVVGDVYHWYIVRATKDGGGSDQSSVQVLLGPPAAPSNLVAYPFSSSSAVVYWIDNSGTEDGFQVQRGPSPVGPWETIVDTWFDNPYFEDYGLVTEQQVCYQVIAFNSKGFSAPSEPDCTAPPAAPTGLAATTVDHQSINLTWDAHPATKDGYTVRDGYWLYRFDPWNGYILLTEPATDATSFSDTGLESQTEYRYLLLALNDGDPVNGNRGYSDWSNEAIATTGPAPGTTSSITAATPRLDAAASREVAARALTNALRARLPVRQPAAAASRRPPPPQ